MRTKTIFLLVIVLVLSVHGNVFAMDYDDLFGGDLFVEFEEDTSGLRPEEALLIQDGWDVGGNYRFSVNASRTFMQEEEPYDNFRASLGGQLYLDARPDPNFRVFGKAGLSYAVNSDADNRLDVELLELFSDFNYDNKVFFRAGKQNASWGVGYFFSPADVISIGRIDPLNPEADLGSPVALKIHYPRRTTNYYLFTLFDGVGAPDEIALAPKVEFVLGGTEVGLGAFYQKDKIPRAMLTLSSSFGDVGLFGEAVVSRGSDQGFLEARGPAYEIVKKDDFFLQATAGGMYSFSDDDGLFNLTGILQYYFNGEGYKDQELIQRIRRAPLNPTEMPLVINPEELGTLRFMNSGRHYLAASLAWNQILGSKFSASSFVQTNLSDGSGIMHNTLSLPSISKISPSVGVSFNFGKEGTEFGAFGRNTTVFAAITLGSGSF